MLLDISESLWKEAVVTQEVDGNSLLLSVVPRNPQQPGYTKAGHRKSEGNKELGNFPVCSAVQQPQLVEVSRARGHHSLTLLPPPERLPRVPLLSAQ